MTTKIEKLQKKLNEEFRNILAGEMLNRYKVRIETNWSFLSNEIISTRIDGEDFTVEQINFMKFFELGYVAAMGMVREET